MYLKTPFFFEAESILKNHEISTVEKIQKYLDAEYTYKKLIVEKLLDKNLSHDALLEIFFSNWLQICEIPLKLHKKFQEEAFIRDIKKMAIKSTLTEMKECQRLIDSANRDNLDTLYLNIFYQYRTGQIDIDSSLTKTNVKGILGYLYQGKDIHKPFKKVMKRIYVRDVNAPAMAGIHFRKKMLAILEPKISAACNHFLQDICVEFMVGTYAIVLGAEADKRIYGDKTIKSLKKYLPNEEALHLINKFLHARQPLEQELVVEKESNKRYLEYFDVMKKIYAVENDITVFLADRKRQEQEAQDKEMVETVSAMSVFEKTKVLEVASVPINQNEPVEVLDIVVPITALEKSVHEEEEQLPVLVEIQDPLAVPQLQNLEIARTEISDDKDKDKDEEDMEPSYTMFYQPFPGKDKKRKQIETVEPPQNILKLEREDLDTYLKVFNLKSYDFINLRALVSLTTQVFGGVIKKSGANRCRIKMKNIYAFILAPQEVLENVSKTATVAMHGGGHRSTRSQNHDREKAPDYLIHQFRSAFERAGFTPTNLGLEHYQEAQNALSFNKAK